MQKFTRHRFISYVSPRRQGRGTWARSGFSLVSNSMVAVVVVCGAVSLRSGLSLASACKPTHRRVRIKSSFLLCAASGAAFERSPKHSPATGSELRVCFWVCSNFEHGFWARVPPRTPNIIYTTRLLQEKMRIYSAKLGDYFDQTLSCVQTCIISLHSHATISLF